MKLTSNIARRARSLATLAGSAGSGMELLEQRALFTAVSWDGGAGDNLWNSPTNWSNDVVPGSADDVTIDVAGTPTIRFLTTSRTINSLVTKENLQLENSTLKINTTAVVDGATLTMQGATLEGGNFSYLNSGKFGFSTSGGTLKDVATNTDLLLTGTSHYIVVQGTTTFNAARLQANASGFYMAPGYTLSSLISVEGAAAGTRTVVLAYGGAGTVTIAPTGIIRLAAGAGGGVSIQNSSPATLQNDGLISAEAAGQTLTIQPTTFNNNKTVQVLAGTLFVNSATMTGSATAAFSAASGTTLRFSATNWTNAGTLSIDTATLSLEGTFPTTGFNFPGFTRNAGTVNLVGTLTNTGSTLALNAATGTWVLLGGTINGGSVTFAGGATLATTSQGGTLNNVGIVGDLLFNTTSAYLAVSGTTSFTAARLQANAAGFYMAPGYTLSSLISVEGAAVGTRTVVLAYGGAGTVTIAPTGIIRLAAGAGGGVSIQNSSPATLQNDGLISAEAAGQTLTIQPTTFNNNKTVQALAGTLFVNATTMTGAATAVFTAAAGTTLRFGATNWTNAGTVSIDTATLSLEGTFPTTGFNFAGFTRNAGTVNLVGTLTNTGSTLALNAATGTWNLSGGTINGGSVSFAGGATLAPTNQGGTLNNVAIIGDIAMATTSSYVVVQGTTSFSAIRLQANAAAVYLAPGFTLNSLISAEGATAGTRTIIAGYGGVGTLTVAPTGIIRLAAGSGGGLSIQNSSAATVVNNGLISAEASGQSLTVQTTTFTNNASGIAQALGGTFTANSTSYTNAGSFKTFTGGVFKLDGTFNATGGIGTFVTTGTGTFEVTGTINNTGNTANLNAATGSWTMRGGQINNGSIGLTGGAALIMTNSGGTLASVAITGELLMNTTSSYIVVSGTTTFTAARLQANSSGLYLAPGYTLTGLVSAEGAATGPRNLYVGYGGAGTNTFTSTAVVRLDATSGGNLTVLNSSAATLDNNGLISAEAPGLTLTIQVNSTFNNKATGTVQALAGTLTINSTTSTNAGNYKVANGAVFNLDGTFNAATGIGTYTNAGTGVTNIVGTITNTGNTITLNATTGSWTMKGGTILNGSINLVAGTKLLATSSGGTINNVAITGEVLLDTTSAYLILAGAPTFNALRMSANATNLYMVPGTTLNSLVSVEGATVGNRAIVLAYGGAGTVTFGPNAIVRLAAGVGGDLSIQNSSAATLVNGGLISAEATGHTITVQNTTFTNQVGGTVQALAGTLSMNAIGYTNAGTFKVATGGVLGLDGGFNATGGIGTFINTGTGVTRVGGNGTITNTGNTITLNATTGSWTMANGTILNGSINLVAGTKLLATSSGGTINNVAITGEVLLDTTSAYLVLAGAPTFNALRMSANATNLYMLPGTTLNSLVSVEGATVGNRAIVLAYGGAGTVTFGPNAIVRLAAGVGGDLSIQNSSAATLVNGGLISAEATGHTITVQNTTFTNQVGGTVQALAGTLSMNAIGYTNAGTFKVATGGVLGLDGGFNATGGIGTFINTGTGVTRVGGSGTITNTGNTITLNATTGTWTMANGTILGGTLTLTGGLALLGSSSGGTLTNLTINGDVQMNVTSAYVILSGTTTFNVLHLGANAANVYMAPGYTLNNQIVIEGAAAGQRAIVLAYGGAGTVTFSNTAIVRAIAGANGSVSFQNSSAATLINNGLMQFQSVGQTANITMTTFTNNGTLDAAGGNVLLNATNLTNLTGNALNGGVWKASNGGSLAGGSAALVKVINVDVILDGANKSWDALNKLETIPVGVTFQLTGGTDQSTTPASGVFTNNGKLILGLGSRLAITGNFVQTATGTLEAHIAGGNPATNYGSVTATGTGSLAGTLNIIADNGYLPSRPDVQDVVKTTGSTTGTFANVTFPITNNPEWKTYFIYTGNGAQLLTTSIIDFNVDGQLDLQDFFEFFNRWDLNDPSLDLNNDGSVDLGDYFLFFNLWDQG